MAKVVLDFREQVFRIMNIKDPIFPTPNHQDNRINMQHTLLFPKIKKLRVFLFVSVAFITSCSMAGYHPV